MSEERYYATGRRKTSVARVWLMPGEGNVTINKRSIDDYLKRETAKMIIRQPLELTETLGKFDIYVNVRGGGISGQAGAIKHGISRALLVVNPDFRPLLKKSGFLTRDSRVKERKKYGQPGARKRFQYSKR
ncbi:MAG: 30S ribosomal protein S9 [Deltaproteobacteria bacterium]|jgi:small subunit ribosomal protein S9|nr:30S ribosomal protein S9 [Deltaproteobacteria bacterium]